MGLFGIRISSRGVRFSVGPRAARVHFGTGRTRISSGIGPVSYSAPVGSTPRQRRQYYKAAGVRTRRLSGGMHVLLFCLTGGLYLLVLPFIKKKPY
ncbi:MAG: hypothetical protein RIS26_1029 [Actinomycetota bacterium]|jgi:predicted amidohydrolase